MKRHIKFQQENRINGMGVEMKRKRNNSKKERKKNMKNITSTKNLLLQM